MTRAYYNEKDRYCCDWLSNLIDAELIMPGKIDDRSIVDVRPDDVADYERVHFFAGIGGWDYALNLAGWNRPVWTGSCPCQPFSLAGKQKGFADERHLWPIWRELIRIGRPATVFGEQVASASAWLGLVRGDLEAMGYAVGAIPIEAASAGADHLRDRYWFVANREGFYGRRGPEHSEPGEIRLAQPCDPGDLGDANGAGLAVGSIAEVQRGDVRSKGAPSSPTGHRGDTVADSDSSAIRLEPGWSSGACWPGAREHRDDSEAGLDVADSEVLTNPRQRLREEQQRHDYPDVERGDWSSELSWVIGADGKARRTKPGIRLLAHGIPNRVGLLRGFGNAIDPRPAAAFIEAAMNSLPLPSQENRGAE